MPSLKQLNEAIASYRDDHPDVLITVVVDATFGHRIDPKEVPEFERAIETNEFVAPPAGTVGRGDGFVLSIAQKANASILSNDSYQEFHGEYAWLFDEGRLIGGKPVPHVGWVFVNRVPVRGPVSRRSVKEQKIVEKSPSRGRGRGRGASTTASISADGPMPVPTAPPPGAVLPGAKPTNDKQAGDKPAGGRQQGGERQRAERNPERVEADASAAERQAQKSTNDLLAFLSFVEHFPVGTAVTAIVDSYSSHGAYVSIGDVKGYVPLRLMAEPAPRSARDVMALGETVTLVVASFGPAKRSVDLAVPAMAPTPAPVAARARKATAKAAAKADKAEKPGTPAKAEKASKARAKKSAAPAPPATADVVSAAIAVAVTEAQAPAKKSARKRGGQRTPAAASPAMAAEPDTVSAAARARRRPRNAPPESSEPTPQAAVAPAAAPAAKSTARPRKAAASKSGPKAGADNPAGG